MKTVIMSRFAVAFAALLALGALRAQMNAGIGGRASADASELTRSIGEAEFGARDQIVSDVEAYLRESDGKVEALKQQAGSLGSEAAEKFKTAVAEIETRREALQQSVDAARQADEQTWASARTQLGANLSAHAGAVAGAEKAASGGR